MSFRKTIEHFVLKYLAVPKTPEVETGKIHIACLGDSITFGAGVNGKKEATWEHFLEEKLGKGYQVLNYGISGRTLQDEGDYPYKADKFYPISKEIKADIYLIMLGTNDAKPYNWDEKRYEEELDRFVSEYMEIEGSKVILMSPPSCFVDRKSGVVLFDIDMKNIDGPIYRIVKKTAEEKGLQLIDLHEHTAGHEEWFADGVHPNEKGNREFAGYIYQNIKEAGA